MAAHHEGHESKGRAEKLMSSSGATKRGWVPILMYHSVDESRSVVSTPPALFEWQMGWLNEKGYRVLPLSRLVQCIRDGVPLPTRSVVISFDDGFESVYTTAFPILARYGFPATVFVVADYCADKNDWPGQPPTVPRLPLLNWTQICEMARHGIEIGAHSLSHPRLDQLPHARVSREILDSKAQIEERLGHPVNLFAYPYGRQNGQVRAIVRRVFEGACTARPDIVKQDSDLLALDRIDALYVAHPLIFRQLLSSWFPLYLGMRRLLRSAASFILRRQW